MKLEEYLNEVSEREGKATSGPWFPSETTDAVGNGYDLACEVPLTENSEANKDFISHSRTDIPRLILLLRAAMEMRSQLRGCCDEFESTEKFDSTVSEILGESK